MRHLTQYGVFSWYELLMRLYMLRVNFRESIGGELMQTQAYKALDPSEKNALSYFMGLTTAKLLANRFLDIPWLIHLDSFEQTRLAFGSKKRPDLLGHNRNHQWLVMEAKGRSGSVEPALMPKALIQTQALETVDSYSPFLRVASASFIKSKKTGVLAAQWECPPGISSNPGVKLKIDVQDFFNRYYELFRNLLNDNNQSATSTTGGTPGTLGFITASSLTDGRVSARFEDLAFRTAFFSEFDIQIGLLDQGNNFFLKNTAWYDNLFLEVNQLAKGFITPRLFIAPDGVLIKLGPSWNSENMQKEPDQRANS